MKDRSDSRSSWYRKPPRANKVEPLGATLPPKPPATYGSCLGAIPEEHACTSKVPANRAAKVPTRSVAPRPAPGPAFAAGSRASEAAVEPPAPSVRTEEARPSAVTAEERPSVAGVDADRASSAGFERDSAAPAQAGVELTEAEAINTDGERTTLTSASAPVAPTAQADGGAQGEALSEDDVMTVGEADVVEFIPVGESATPEGQEEQGTLQDTPAVVPTTVPSGSARPAERALIAKAAPQPKSRRTMAVLALAAGLALAAWAGRGRISAALSETPGMAGSPGRSAMAAKVMRFEVPDLVVTLPIELPKPTIVAAPAVAAPKPGGRAKDAAALAELERIAAGLSGGDGKKK